MLALNAGSTIQVFDIRDNNFNRFTSFDLIAPVKNSYNNHEETVIRKSETFLFEVYGQMYCAHVSTMDPGYNLDIYLLHREASRTHIYPITETGPFIFNVVDDLLVLTFWQSKKVVLIDLNLSPYQALASTIDVDNDLDQLDCVEGTTNNYVIMGKGNLCRLFLELASISTYFPKADESLVLFLLRRDRARDLILDTLKRFMENRAPLTSLYNMFEAIIKISSENTQEQNTSLSEEPSKISRFGLSAFGNISGLSNSQQSLRSETRPPKDAAVLAQNDLYTLLFQPFQQNEHFDDVYFASVLIEYVRALYAHKQKVESYIDELIVLFLLKIGKVGTFDHLSSGAGIRGSSKVAMKLISAKDSFPRLFQRGLDMLDKLDRHDLIIEILVKHGKVMEAIRVARERSLLKKLNPKQILDQILESQNELLYYNVYKFLEQRNIYLYQTPKFHAREDCDAHFRHFQVLVKRLSGK